MRNGEELLAMPTIRCPILGASNRWQESSKWLTVENTRCQKKYLTPSQGLYIAKWRLRYMLETCGILWSIGLYWKLLLAHVQLGWNADMATVILGTTVWTIYVGGHGSKMLKTSNDMGRPFVVKGCGLQS